MSTAAPKAPDVLARPLALALKKLEQAGWQAEIVRAEPYLHHPALVWHDDSAYILKQTVVSDHTLQIIVGCKFEGRCTDQWHTKLTKTNASAVVPALGPAR
ncbi:hypothetical protein [Acidaminococcus fermentans]|uniref:hypothetical protein n=1 Tax=Acidaminococcus fermentans TaxID=905 RepID=UPI002491A0D2|nr:hypothetical protein [Acidaminococcus fermentans]